jgi:predicted pyridoxine 5'-phosphate oxidase superfamily flavin-nucleotide-binding protein
VIVGDPLGYLQPMLLARPTMLTPDMKRIIEEQRLGFVATADLDGTPNMSPKGSMLKTPKR